MDLGFKDKSLIDSDEQLAGRVNRNAGKNECKVYIFDFDRESDIYSKDYRYQKTRDEISHEEYKLILETKDFDKLYGRVNAKITAKNADQYQVKTLSEYKSYLKNFQFSEVNRQFRLIEDANVSVFVPLPIPKSDFSEDDLKTLNAFGINADQNDEIDGEVVWNKYIKLTDYVQSIEGDYIAKQVSSKRFNGIFSKFIFSIYEKQSKELILGGFCGDPSLKDKYGILILQCWKSIYSYEGGFDVEKLNSDNFL
jgi:CRISPR-associated endonuclease/helicase Cas3